MEAVWPENQRVTLFERENRCFLSQDQSAGSDQDELVGIDDPLGMNSVCWRNKEPCIAGLQLRPLRKTQAADFAEFVFHWRGKKSDCSLFLSHRSEVQQSAGSQCAKYW